MLLQVGKDIISGGTIVLLPGKVIGDMLNNFADWNLGNSDAAHLIFYYNLLRSHLECLQGACDIFDPDGSINFTLVEALLLSSPTYNADTLYLVTSRCDDRDVIYLYDGDREIFLDVLVADCKRCNWTVHAYCLMGNHYHLLLKTADGNLSMGMRQCRGQDCIIEFFDVE